MPPSPRPHRLVTGSDLRGTGEDMEALRPLHLEILFEPAPMSSDVDAQSAVDQWIVPLVSPPSCLPLPPLPPSSDGHGGPFEIPSEPQLVQKS